jgi:hypothetical protein
MKVMSYTLFAAIILVAAANAAPDPATGGRGHTACAVMRSTVVDSASYDLAKRELTVFFRTGAAYKYDNVPEEVFSGLVNAEKPGRFFSRNIRHKYESHRLATPVAAALADSAEAESAW